MGYKLGTASEAKLVGVHPDLVKVVRRAIELSAIDFRVTEGVRTIERQRQLVAKGASQTLRSRHIPGTNRSGKAEAVDVVALVGGKVAWDWPLYPRIAAAFKEAAEDLDIPIVWGGDWVNFRDGPHFELKRGNRYG